MTGFELYVFFLCLIVFTALTALFTIFTVWLVRLIVRLIRGGLEDEKIKNEYYKDQCRCKCGGGCGSEIFDKIVSAIFGILFLGIFVFSLALNLSEEKKVGDIPVMRVVQSGSMSKKYEKNKYLFDNALDDQIQTFDIIITEKLPDEKDLKLYDIVVYEVDDTLVVHRIIKIEEPNKDHPDCRWFTLQGDNVQYPDKTPVLYSQMIAIYRGNRIPFIGSFVSFMQSPAGYLCVILIVFGSIAIPVVEKILEKEREKRLIAIGELPTESEMLSEWQPADEEQEFCCAESSAVEPNLSETPVVEDKPLLETEPLVENFVEEKAKEESTVATKAEETEKVEKPTPVMAQKPKTDVVKKATTSKFRMPTFGCVDKPTPVEKGYSGRCTGDWFYDSLTMAEKAEFTELFVYKNIGGKIRLPEYVIGGDNYEFFFLFFTYVHSYKNRISPSLLNKMYQYRVKKF